MLFLILFFGVIVLAKEEHKNVRSLELELAKHNIECKSQNIELLSGNYNGDEIILIEKEWELRGNNATVLNVHHF